MKNLIAFSLIIMLAACANTPVKFYQPTNFNSQQFADLWYDGNAELAVYKVSQSRYGQLRDGQAVLITVSEPFDTQKQVKSDCQDSDDYQVLKTNFVKRFTTGIYDYSVMTSAFTPINTKERQAVSKISNSIQDWCGQAYTQLNRREADYKIEVFSYFESEYRDQSLFKVDLIWDEVFALIRMNPDLLPQGDFSFSRSPELVRYMHKGYSALSAKGELKVDGDQMLYSIKAENEEYQWTFEKEFPHKILVWKELKLSGDESIENQSTTAVLTQSGRYPYWQLNGNGYENLRDSLGINFYD